MTARPKTTLRYPPPLNQMTEAEALAFDACTTRVRFAKGEQIVQANSDADACYLVDEGAVRLQLERPDLDTEPVVGFVEPGQILGEWNLLERRPHRTNAYAETEVVKLRRIDIEKFDSLSESYPALAIKLLSVLGRHAAEELETAREQLADFTSESADSEIDDLVRRAKVVQREFTKWPEARVNSLLFDIAALVGRRARQFAKTTVVETGVGDVHGKTLKNQNASMLVLQNLMTKTGIGVISEDTKRGVTEIAAPVGVVAGLIPITSPIATGIFKILLCLKARNAIILSPHRGCRGVFSVFCEMVREVLLEHGAPEDLVQYVKRRVSRKKTQLLMSHTGIDLVLATGGGKMVEAAYRSGKPAFGVGPGNAPVLIGPDADLHLLAKNVVLSKSFDNGLICGSENNLVVLREHREALEKALVAEGAAVLSPVEVDIFTTATVNQIRKQFRPRMVGQSAEKILGGIGIKRNYHVRLIVVPTEKIEYENPFSREKMAPMVSLFTVESVHEGLDSAEKIITLDGTGHTAIIYSYDKELIAKYGERMLASRILVNTPGSQGITGATTALPVSMMLGCGTFGGNSTTENIDLHHVQNIKRVAHHDADKDTMLDFIYHVSPGAAIGMQLLGYDGVEVEAEGCVVRDRSGREYLDFLAGYGVLSLGHRHPKVVEAVKKQLDRMPFSSRMMLNEQQATLGRRLADITPGNLTYSFFANSGTEAVEGALKLARGTTERSKIVSTVNAYHGKSFGALAASGREVYKEPFLPMLEGFSHVPFNDLEAMEKQIDNKVAAVILEPVQGEGGVNVARPEYLRAVRDLCDRNGALLILDEVQTGLGRTGTMFACEQAGIVPDIMVLAKALSGGVIPVGAIVATPAVWELFNENPFIHSSTFGGNPLACAAALAAIQVITEENLPKRAAEMGAYLTEHLKDIQKEFPEMIKEVRGPGLFIGVEFSSEDVAVDVIQGMARKLIIAAYTLNQPRVIRFEPPLIVTKAQCDRCAEAVRYAVAEAAKITR